MGKIGIQSHKLVRKYYPFAGKRSPYIIPNSNMAESDYIKYSELSRGHHPNTNFKVWKILIIASICLTGTVLLHQCFNLDRFYQSQHQIDEIIIITKTDNDRTSEFENSGISKDTNRRTQQYNHNVKKCIPGTTMMQDCNTCTCSDKGEYGCTKMFCGTLGANTKGLNLGLVLDK